MRPLHALVLAATILSVSTTALATPSSGSSSGNTSLGSSTPTRSSGWQPGRGGSIAIGALRVYTGREVRGQSNGIPTTSKSWGASWSKPTTNGDAKRFGFINTSFRGRAAGESLVGRSTLRGGTTTYEARHRVGSLQSAKGWASFSSGKSTGKESQSRYSMTTTHRATTTTIAKSGDVVHSSTITANPKTNQVIKGVASDRLESSSRK